MRTFGIPALTALAAAAILAACAGPTGQPGPNAYPLVGSPTSNSPGRARPAREAWQVVESPNKGRKLGNVLYAVADISSSDAWAVGAWPARSQYLTDTLAEHWDGAHWTIVPTPRTATPTAQLKSIVALASNAVWAAGYAEDPGCICGHALVDYWNGSVWSEIKTPTSGIASFLSGISAVSAHEIWAVGDAWPSQQYDSPLILGWNGKRWSSLLLTQYQVAQLYSVYAPAHDDAWAFGFTRTGMLVLHWNGTLWTPISFPGTAQIVSVSGTSSSDVWAAGYYYCGSYCNPEARLFHWNGSQWSPVYVEGFSQPSIISGIVAVSRNDAWFTGYGMVFPKWQNYISNVTYHWDGEKWTDVDNPVQIRPWVLNAVSARASGAWVVGQGGSKGTFTMHRITR